MKRKILFGVVLVFIVIILIKWHEAFTTPASAPCVNRLMVINSAKEQWVINNKYTTNKLSWSSLMPYLPPAWADKSYWTNGNLICPEGGFIALGSTYELPKCSLGGRRHSVPEIFYNDPSSSTNTVPVQRDTDGEKSGFSERK